MKMNDAERITSFLENADAVLIGGGAGLSEEAGIDYSGENFKREFADYIERYGFTDLYTSGFYNFATEGERWTRWVRHINYTVLKQTATRLYCELFDLVRDRNHFVITTNVDAQFEKASFARERLFAVQGDYREMQCARACHNKVYSCVEVIKNILTHAKNFTIPDPLIPRCPVCAGKMEMHLRIDKYFIEDEQWVAAATRYQEFLDNFSNARLLLLEAGVGFNTPGIIRFPFENIVRQNPDSLLVRINPQISAPMFPIQDRLINITEGFSIFIKKLFRPKI